MPPYWSSFECREVITVVVEFGEEEGAGQYAKERCVRVGTFLANARKRVQDTVDDG